MHSFNATLHGEPETVTVVMTQTPHSMQHVIIFAVLFGLTFWSEWLHRVERVKAFNPRVAARWVRRRFRENICKVASNLAPSFC